MVQKFTLFDFKFDNDEVEEEFQRFFNRYNLTALFTDEHRATPIRVTWADARSVVNVAGQQPTGLPDKTDKETGEKKQRPNLEKSGRDRTTLLKFQDYLTMSSNNLSYQEAVFKIIQQAKSFRGMINIMKKLMQYMDSEIDNDHMYNMWNIVWYNKDAY